MRQNRFNISTGVIEVNYPMTMTADDVQDFKDQMAITFRILERKFGQERTLPSAAESAPASKPYPSVESAADGSNACGEVNVAEPTSISTASSTGLHDER